MLDICIRGFLSPERAPYNSPGQRPGWQEKHIRFSCSPERALQLVEIIVTYSSMDQSVDPMFNEKKRSFFYLLRNAKTDILRERQLRGMDLELID